ncbi:MAG: DUF305 domain-containing protein [Candidatus Paceibacterota bacterium]|jgi:uncharacterized protein (DUF305 family)
MKKEIIISGLVGAFIGILVLLFFFGTWGWNFRGWNSMMGGDNNNRQGGMMGDISRYFIEQMIPHHDDAIIMAEIAFTKAEHSEIKQLAEDIKRTQSEENAMMREWYKTWYGTNVSDIGSAVGHGMGGGMMNNGMMGSATDVNTLKIAKLFDKEFIEQMIPHHQMAVMMANMALNSSDRSEIKQLAKNIISAQTKEIESMRTWYSLWYVN